MTPLALSLRAQTLAEVLHVQETGMDHASTIVHLMWLTFLLGKLVFVWWDSRAVKRMEALAETALRSSKTVEDIVTHVRAVSRWADEYPVMQPQLLSAVKCLEADIHAFSTQWEKCVPCLGEDRSPQWALSILLARLERAKTLMKENEDE